MLSADQARRAFLRGQGLLGRPGQTAAGRHPAALLGRLGGFQLDTISVLARSHELVCYARCGPVGRPAVEDACWGREADGSARAFEYWAHAACVLPAGSWSRWAFRRRAHRLRSAERHPTDGGVREGVLRRLERDGPLTASELGGAKQGGDWWDWSPVKHAVEVLLACGDVVCTTRRGWKRVYDLPERALPPAVLGPEPSDDECLAILVAEAGRCLAVATASDLAEYFRLRRDQVVRALPASGLLPVSVEGWADPAWADPEGLELVDQRGRHRTTLLSPFDSAVWDRPRTRRLWGFTHRIEAYTPAHARVHGYYPMPLLAGGRLVARVDPARRGRTLVARRVGLARRSVDPGTVAAALGEAAGWVGADDVAVEAVDPPSYKPSLQAALAAR